MEKLIGKLLFLDMELEIRDDNLTDGFEESQQTAVFFLASRQFVL